MKKIHKIMALVLCGLMSSAVLVGCGNREGEITYDEKRTQLFVYNYNGGPGSEWLEKGIKPAFEAAYADYKGVDGKVGVELIIDPNKIKGADLLGNVEGSINEIFITEATNYYDVVNQGLALDLTETLNEVGTDNKTILSKFTDVSSAYYNVSGKYYAVPHYYMPYGITYNEDIFEKKNLYFAKNGCPSERLQVGGSFTRYKYSNNLDENKGNLSAGPDGKYETADDGLPATYEEFYVLMDKMVEVGVTPFVYTGQYEAPYMNWFAGRLTTDYEGEENLKTMMSRSGKLKNTFVESVSDDGSLNIVDEYTVSGANAEAAVHRTAGYYYALQFIEKLYSNSLYSATRRPGMVLSHTEAQQEFLTSAQTFYQDKPIAMLIEGVWWENESVLFNSFEQIAQKGGQTREEFRLKFMAMPHATEEKIGSNPISAECIDGYMFVSSGIAKHKIDLANEFIKFVNSDEMLSLFHTKTNIPRALNYTLDETAQGQLSYFGKSVYDYVNNAGKFFQCSPTEAFLNNPTRISSKFVTAKYDSVMYIRSKNVKAIDFFKGILALNPIK